MNITSCPLRLEAIPRCFAIVYIPMSQEKFSFHFFHVSFHDDLHNIISSFKMEAVSFVAFLAQSLAGKVLHVSTGMFSRIPKDS